MLSPNDRCIEDMIDTCCAQCGKSYHLHDIITGHCPPVAMTSEELALAMVISGKADIAINTLEGLMALHTHNRMNRMDC